MNITGETFNYPDILPCLSKARELYQILLQPAESVIEADDFYIEMQAAQIADQNILRFILQNENMDTIDFLDYLTFFPLFLYTHGTIVGDVV